MGSFLRFCIFLSLLYVSFKFASSCVDGECFSFSVLDSFSFFFFSFFYYHLIFSRKASRNEKFRSSRIWRKKRGPRIAFSDQKKRACLILDILLKKKFWHFCINMAKTCVQGARNNTAHDKVCKSPACTQPWFNSTILVQELLFSLQASCICWAGEVVI